MQIHLPPKILVLSIGLTAILHYTVPGVYAITKPYNSVGWLIIVIGIICMIWTRQTLQRQRTTLHPTEQPNSLVTTGPFRISRNPFYVGYLLVALGVATILGSLLAFFGPLVFLVWINSKVIPTEEHNLEQVFDQRYREYKKHVRRWL